MTEIIKKKLPESAVELPTTSYHRFAGLLRADESLSETELSTKFWAMRDSIAVALGLPSKKTSWTEIARTMETALNSGVAVLPQILLADGSLLQEESWSSFITCIDAYQNNLPSSATDEVVRNKEQVVKEIRQKSLVLSEHYGEGKEALAFPGISKDVHQKMRDEEKYLPEGYFTPIDELIVTWSKGIKITCNPDGSNPLFSPAEGDFDADSSFPIDKLDSARIQDSELKELLELIQKSVELSATNK